jgi:hypothetical protein
MRVGILSSGWMGNKNILIDFCKSSVLIFLSIVLMESGGLNVEDAPWFRNKVLCRATFRGNRR